MKLSSRDIAIIEDLLTQRERGATSAELAKACGLKRAHSAQAFATMFSMLKSVGVNVPAAITRGEQMKREMAEFRAWKAQRAIQAESTLIPRVAQVGLPNANGLDTYRHDVSAVRVTGL